ncbi:MAG: DUF4838 domain-containing protein [Oscillospiraceae bacterium]|nr:DUF4838 domain-containing protein [Oscillospiraceae bacterium]
MLKIYLLRNQETLYFAAAELKKYLRMMMPQENQIAIFFDPAATEGFRLGLLEDFGLPNPAENPVMDDIVHIDTTETGGILAGSNPRSVLFAVYRLLRLNGCRFLAPGPEGERIPQQPLKPQSYHKAADHRIRGRTIEGRPSLEQVLSSLDYYAKEELNAFGCYGVAGYHSYYYLHRHNPCRAPEFFDMDLADSQWRSLYEAEAQKRGLMIVSGEHEMIPNALGLKESDRFLYKEGKKQVPPEIIPFLAQMGGVRKLHKNELCFTNVCMSNPVIREKMAQAVVQEIENRPHLQIFGCTVADTSNNHCECEACQKKLPSDWYVMVLNRIDELLTQKGIATKVQFSFYVDMIFAPETERLQNPDRFILQYCPISRSYTKSLTADTVYPTETTRYVRNNWEAPKSEEELMALFKKWQAIFPGPCYVFEYHYWIHQFRDPGMLSMARRVYEDIRGYRYTGMQGCMQDGSNKNYWPNGFLMHIYNETMMNRDCDFEAELQDFFAAQYGESWQVAKTYLQDISDAFDHKYMCGERSEDPKVSTHYNPGHADSLRKVAGLSDGLIAFVETLTYAHRAEYLGWKLLTFHARFCKGLAEALLLRCQGDTAGAVASFDAFLADFGKYDIELENRFDFELAAQAMKVIISKMPKVEF